MTTSKPDQRPATTIAIAEPDAAVFKAVDEILATAFDATCVWTVTPKETLDLIATAEVDLAIVSREFPHEEPEALLRTIKQRSPDLPVIITTAKPSVAAAVACLKLGAIDYLEKPLPHHRLVQVVGDLIADNRRQLAASTAEFEPDDEIIGAYRLINKLGSGALATVYRAVRSDDPDGEQVALKVLRGGIIDDETRRVALERFVREAELAAEVAHPNVVRLIDYGLADEAMLPFIAYELVEGQALTHYVEARSLPVHAAVRLMEQAAAALAAIHDYGIIHRDLKPDNLLVTPDLKLKVTDFGVSRKSESNLTRANCTVGTPFYLPPESLSKKPVDARCDQFSLGCVAYELLTGERPFPGTTLPEIIRNIRKSTPIDPQERNPQLPIGLCELLMRLLSKDPDERFPDCHEVEAAFAACRRQLPTAIPPSCPPPSSPASS